MSINQNLHVWEWRAMAETNLQLALTNAMQLPAGEARNQALAAICFAVAEKDPADAIQLAQTLQLDQQPGGTMETLVQQWASSNVSAALTWADQQPAGSQRDAMMDRIAFVMSQSDPSDAANLVLSEIPPGPSQDEAVMTVLHQWGTQNLTAAAYWVGTFPDTPLRNRALDELEGMENFR